MVNLNPVDNLNIVPNQNFANHVPQFANRNSITPVQFLHNPNVVLLEIHNDFSFDNSVITFLLNYNMDNNSLYKF